MILYIWKWCLQDKKRGGMGVVIKELTHPYSLTHKDYKKKRMRLFCVGFPKEIEVRENVLKKKKKFLRLFFQIFFITFPLFFFSLFLFFSPSILPSYFSQKWGGGVFIEDVRKWEARISVSGYTSASRPLSDTLMLASHFCCLISLYSSFFDF